MLNRKPFSIFLRMIPLLILLVIGIYFSSLSYVKYINNKQFSDALENVQLLQDYENAVLNERLCFLLLSPALDKNKKICEERVIQSSALLAKLKKQDTNLENWINQIDEIKTNKKTVSNFETFLGKKGLHSVIESYIDTVEFKTTVVEEKELLRLYKRLSDVSYATALENFLLTYYVSKKIEVPGINLIYWDKIVEASELIRVEDEKYIPSLKETLSKIENDETLRNTLSKIDDMRITILTGQMKIDKNNLDWIVLVEKKQESLMQMEKIIAKKLNMDTSARSQNALIALFVFLLIILIAMIALWNVFRNYRDENRDNKALLEMINKINALSIFDNDKSDAMDKMLNDAKTKEDMFIYIHSSFQLLHEKEKQSRDEATSKSDFLSTLSHEIRTPLNGIIGFSKVLKDMGVGIDQEEFLSLIEHSSHNLIAIVNDILDLSKINADKMETENVSFDIFDTLESTIAPFTHQTDQKDIELGLFIDPFLSHYFMGDATKLSQVLTNLVGNAVKFTDEYGKINIYVQCLKNLEHEVQIKFAVHDDGIGLSQEQIKNIFNAFTQATKTTSKKYGGTGLGLTISAKMVKLMGGKLEVESKENNGATFSFILTLTKDTEKNKTFEAYPDFSNATVGLALPVRGIKRQLDTNLEIYIKHFGAEFNYYYYDDLFASDMPIQLPDLMIFDHHYARLSGELEQCATIKCKTVLLTNGTLRSRVNPRKHNFNDIILTPLSLHKCMRILKHTLNKSVVPEIKKTTIKNIESFKGIRALVADDNVINRKLIKIILEKLGLHVTLTSDGSEAFEMYKKNSYGIIFMDIQMPVMDGIEATQKILAYEVENEKMHTPIIAVTANVALNDKEHYLAEGMDDYATKPLEIETIKGMIEKYCDCDEKKNKTIKSDENAS